MKVGVWVPGRGEQSIDPGIAVLARHAELAGFDSLIVPDHVVMVRETRSWFPFADDGVPVWDVRTPWNDVVVALALCAAATTRIEIGTGVLVLPQRHPVELAKQIATIDVASGGRVFLGLGAGWLAEEFDALGVPFDTRGTRFEEWVTILREMWTGAPSGVEGRHYRLPSGLHAYPRPVRDIPILVGGMSRVALRRAGEADGWFALQRTDALDVEHMSAGVRRLRETPGGPGRVVLRAVGDVEGLLRSMPALAAAGVTEVVVDADLTDPQRARRVAERVRDACD